MMSADSTIANNSIETVSWKSYAQKYDMLLDYNPFYQALNRDVLDSTSKWKVKSKDILLDIGAGTGNFSIPLAKQHSNAKVIHLDRDEGMNLEARKKSGINGTDNLTVLDRDVETIEFEENSISGIVCVHSLYTLNEPQEMIKKMALWLKPGSKAVLVNAGRIVNVLSWQIAIGYHLVKEVGFARTLEILKEGKEVSKQNAIIRQMQKDGRFWTHSHQEFLDAVKDSGLVIEESYRTFRGVSDFVLARKES